MNAQDCATIIGAIAAAQVAMVAALGALYVRVRDIQRTASSNADSLTALITRPPG